ncbi:MAG: hypothetical protein HYY23_21535 [Verrucomicrobia bacterium]|nr:hypothetical protein [Verrucomicrobiota bacterium]
MAATEVISQLPFTLLLLPLGLVLAVTLGFALLIRRHVRTNRSGYPGSENPDPPVPFHGARMPGWNPSTPRCWCAIRSSSLPAVQAALGLHNAKPCSWGEGMAQLAAHSLLVSPPIRGWVLVVGHGLPDPVDDPDRSFHFLRRLSRTLGYVQCFSVQPALNHHAWAKLEDGKVLRAYAWAGETVWNEGALTREEIGLGLKCFDYGEPASDENLSPNELLHGNLEKTNRLAARWSVDPASVNEAAAASGESVMGDLVHSKLS